MREIPKVSDAVRALNPDLYPPEVRENQVSSQYDRPTKGDVKSHKDLQRLAELEITRRGVRQHLHLSDATRMKKVGWPDSTFVLCGIPVAIEYKIHPDKLSPDQARTLEDMKADGWRVFVCYSFQEVVDALNRITVPS